LHYELNEFKWPEHTIIVLIVHNDVAIRVAS
jgi:hypothetical protein